MNFDQNIIFIIVAAVIGISRLIARISENAREQKQREEMRRAAVQRQQAPPSRPEVKTDDQRIRKFLEALGQPANAAPPPKVQPRTNLPPRPLLPVQSTIAQRSLPGRPTWKEIKRRMVVQQPTTPAQEIVSVSTPAQTNEPGAWMREEKKIDLPAKSETPRPPTVITGAVLDWKTALHSPDAIRSAVILREILGPPRGLNSPEFA